MDAWSGAAPGLTSRMLKATLRATAVRLLHVSLSNVRIARACFCAAVEANVETNLAVLARHGANLTARNAEGRTPLEMAEAMGHDECLAVLAAHGVSHSAPGGACLLSAGDTVGRFRCAKPGCGSAGTQACHRCNVARYCSRECQRTDWPVHMRSCTQGTPRKRALSLTALARLYPDRLEGLSLLVGTSDAGQSIVRDVHALQAAVASRSTGRWHAELTFKRLYERFTMSFQLRVEDELTLSGQPHGRYRAQANGDLEGRLTMDEFRAYYQKAKATRLFPRRWRVENGAKLVRRAEDAIHSALRESDVIERFGYSSNEHKVLRSIAEQVLGPIGNWLLEVSWRQAPVRNIFLVQTVLA